MLFSIMKTGDRVMNIFYKPSVGKTDNLIEYLELESRCYGKENEDKTIYYICENNGNLGFFAMYRYWVEYLYFADICGYAPVIYAGREFAYGEENRINKTKNPFEYFFVQPTEMRLQQVRSSRSVIVSNVLHRRIVEFVYTGKYDNYLYTQNYLHSMSGIIKKYVKFNKVTWEFIEKSLEEIGLYGKKILGVHVRGTDFRSKYNNHPVYVTAEECFCAIDRILENRNYDMIFVATDDERILGQFVDQYKNRMCFYRDVERNDKNVSVAFTEKNRENHKYRLGLEVIRDMYTLALCDGLVAGVSQVAVCAQMNKMAMGKAYEDLEIIDKGIYKSLRRFNRNKGYLGSRKI